LPLSKRAGEQHTVDVDTAARDAYVLLRTQSGGQRPRASSRAPLSSGTAPSTR
jgi:hypothetical protein